MPTILHFSDLHRTDQPKIDNASLLASIRNDAHRWADAGIPDPDLVIVSGDLVQGVGADVEDYKALVHDQYSEATEFLVAIADQHLDGDRQRVVIVPGNHDVCWPAAKAAMRQVATPERIGTRCDEPDSGLRWDWRTQVAHEIADHPLYDARLECFRQFRQAFYAGIEPNPLRHDPDVLHVEFPDLGLLVVGLSSWFGNDCYCVVGDIDPRHLALAQQIAEQSTMEIAMAVWHHSIAGGPRQRDYMDTTPVHRLIDSGYVVGFHGHQHIADAVPYGLTLPNRSGMSVICAGSLCVGDREIPAGERRQFNLVQIDTSTSSVTVHVRGMTASGLFDQWRRMEFGGEPYVRLALPTSLTRKRPPTTTTLLDDAITLIANGQSVEAIERLDAAERLGAHGDVTRTTRIEALTQLGDDQAVIDLIGAPPRTADELMLAVKLLAAHGDFAQARHLVNSADHVDAATRGDVHNHIDTKEAGL